MVKQQISKEESNTVVSPIVTIYYFKAYVETSHINTLCGVTSPSAFLFPHHFSSSTQ